METYFSVKIYIDEKDKDICIAYLDKLDFNGIQDEPWGLVAYMKNKDFIISIKNKLKGFNFIKKIEIEEVENINWNKEWESNYPPTLIDDDILIQAPFHKINKRYKYEIIINPQMAFGTGHHNTTQLMASILNNTLLNNVSLIDIGCGTGILSILAHIKGAKYVMATDYDQLCELSFKENMKLNKLKDIDFYLGDITKKQFLNIFYGKKFDFLLANINRNIILNSINQLISLMKSKGSIITSGYHSQDIPNIKRAFQLHGYKMTESRKMGEWVANRFDK